jgi:hypothetical protein
MLRIATALTSLLWATAALCQAPSPAFQTEIERISRETKTELNGPKGDEAATICRRIAGVTVPAKTGKDVIAAGYSSETAIKFVDCVVNYMYPVDAKKTEELDRKIGAR